MADTFVSHMPATWLGKDTWRWSRLSRIRRAAAMRGYRGRVSMEWVDVHGRPKHLVAIHVHVAKDARRG